MLTDTKLRGLKPKTNIYRVADTNGLWIEVRTTGAKLWRYRYAGKASMAALGGYPMMGLADARAERDRMGALVKSGPTPGHVTRVERAAKVERAEPTLAAVAIELRAKRVADSTLIRNGFD